MTVDERGKRQHVLGDDDELVVLVRSGRLGAQEVEGDGVHGDALVAVGGLGEERRDREVGVAGDVSAEVGIGDAAALQQERGGDRAAGEHDVVRLDEHGLGSDVEWSGAGPGRAEDLPTVERPIDTLHLDAGPDRRTEGPGRGEVALGEVTLGAEATPGVAPAAVDAVLDGLADGEHLVTGGRHHLRPCRPPPRDLAPCLRRVVGPPHHLRHREVLLDGLVEGVERRAGEAVGPQRLTAAVLAVEDERRGSE